MPPKQGLKPISDISNSVQFQGGTITVREKALVPFGGYSMLQNVRQRYPGLEQRGGQRKKHSTMEGISKFLSLYQFSKGKRTERHFFAQASDRDILEALDAPPTVTTGKFGSPVFVEEENPIPASWSNLNDLMVFSNGADQHKIYAGTANYVTKFIKYDGSAAPPTVPTIGIDYTRQVTDGLVTNVAILDSLDTYANNECVFFCTPIPANRATLTMGKVNTTGAVGTLSYVNSSNTWTDTEETDGTALSGATLGQTGSMVWDFPTDQIPSYMYGVTGFWYRWETATQLDGQVEITSVTYGTDGKGATTPARQHFRDIVNVWSGSPTWAIEARFYDESAKVYKNSLISQGASTEDIDAAEQAIYLKASGDLLAIGGMTTSDYIYFNSFDPLVGAYLDIGDTPNTEDTTSFAEDDISVWTGVGFTSVGALTDSTSGLANSGWITWARQGSEQKSVGDSGTFGTSPYYSYWYRVKVTTATVSAGVQIGIETMPYFDIADFGMSQTSSTWKDRMCYTFDRYPNNIYVSARNRPMVLNGPDFAVLKTGDGRSNAITCMKKFHNELMVWQREKGKEGGTVTLFQGDKPAQYGPLLLSSYLGTFNAKSAEVVDGLKIGETIKTLAFWISYKGIAVSDGTGTSIVSDAIANYFDITKTECIRRGSENEMWLGYDSNENTINIGLVSGEPIMTSTTTSTVVGKLADTAGAFTTQKTVSGHPITHTIGIGDTVYNTTDATTTTIRSINSATDLTLVADIMTAGEGYEIYSAIPNLFPVLDLTDWTWSFDNFVNPLSCMTEVEAASGNASVLQYGGGAGGDAAFVYQLNYGTNDVSTLINAFALLEFNKGGLILDIRRLLLTMKVQSAGNCTVTPYKNGTAGNALTLSMTAETIGDAMRRQLVGIKAQDEQLSLKFQNNTVSQSLYLFELGLEMYEKEGH